MVHIHAKKLCQIILSFCKINRTKFKCTLYTKKILNGQYNNNPLLFMSFREKTAKKIRKLKI